MKFKLTLLVFRGGKWQGEIDVLAEFPDAIAALNAVAQLGAANSLLFHHQDVKALLDGISPKSLARIHETMGESVVVQIKTIAEHRDVIPEKLRHDPELLYHVLASRPRRKIPTEGIITVVSNDTIH